MDPKLSKDPISTVVAVGPMAVRVSEATKWGSDVWEGAWVSVGGGRVSVREALGIVVIAGFAAGVPAAA